MNYYGDFAEDATVYLVFNTFTSDDPQASATITNLADADIMVHKDGGTTQIVTDGATVAIDFDGITGNHLITIDTSVHADYATGSDYMVRIEGTTVDGATINAWVGSFSIQNRYSAGALRPTTAGRTLDVTATGAAGIDWANVENPTTSVDLSATAISLCDTVTANTDMRGTDSAATATALATAQTDLDTITGSDGVTLATAQSNYTPATASDVSTALGTYDGPTNGEMVAAFTEIKGATWASGTDTLEAIRDRGDAAWTTGAGGTPPQLLQSTTIATLATQTSFTLTAGSADNDAYNGAVAIVTDSATSTQKAVGSISDYVGATKTVTLSTDPAIFTMAAGDTIDILAAISNAPTAASIRAEIDSNSTQLAAIVADTNELQTNQGNWVTATGFATAAALATVDANVDAILVDTNTTLQGLITDVPSDVLTNLFINSNWTDLVSDVSNVLVDTGTTIPGTIATVDANVDAILVDTGTTIPGTIATVDTNVDTLITQLTTAVAEPTGAPGATATVAQMLAYMFSPLRNKVTVNSSTMTFYNDAGTAVWSKALSDDATTYTETEGV